MYFRSPSIILKTRNLRESDQIVSTFTEKEGKITAVAKGVKKPKSSLRGCVQPFCYSHLFFSKGRDMDLITQGKIIDFFGNSREDINRTLYCIYMMELMDKSLMEKVPMPNLFAVCLEVLQAMNKEGFNPMLIRYFESRLLVNLGYKPVLDRCARCSRPESKTIDFSMADGGLICDSCRETTGTQMSLRGDCLALIKLLFEGSFQAVRRVKASSAATQQLEVFLEAYLEYHVERKFRVKNTILWLKQTILAPI